MKISDIHDVLSKAIDSGVVKEEKQIVNNYYFNIINYNINISPGADFSNVPYTQEELGALYKKAMQEKDYSKALEYRMMLASLA